MKPTFLVVDLFCGAGGTTTGFAMAKENGMGIAKVIACVNHDYMAIESHWANHPDVNHYTEDIRTLDLTGLIQLVNYYRYIYPEALLILWASLECTNFSKAKGGQDRDPDSRTLAHHLERYVTALNPDYVQIENVVEFKDWGPMQIKPKKEHEREVKLPNGRKWTVYYTELATRKDKETKATVYAMKPIKERKGEDFKAWCQEMCDLGYHNEWHQMNSANYGAYTSRNRFFGCFARHGLPIIWPEHTHSKKPTKGKELWKAVKDVLDLDDDGTSIFERINFIKKAKAAKKLLQSGKKCKAIHAVCVGKDSLIIPHSRVNEFDQLIAAYHPNHLEIKYFWYDDLVPKSLERIYAGLIKFIAGGMPAFILKYNSFKDGKHYSPGIDGPARTITSTAGNQELVQPCFLTMHYSNGSQWNSIEGPAGTIPCKDRFQKIQAVWLDKQFSGSRNHSSIDNPAGVIMPNDKHSKVTTSFINRDFSGGGYCQSIEVPAGSVMPVPKMSKVQVSFIMPTRYDNNSKSLDEPCPTLTADRHYHYLLNPSYWGHTHSVHEPAPTIIAGQDKSPIYMLIVEYANAVIPVYADDSPIMVKIKEFMAIYKIKDIRMRMLKVMELLKIQGFPAGYKLAGTQGDQKKFIGNSVEPHVVEHWSLAMHTKLKEYDLTEYRQAA